MIETLEDIEIPLEVQNTVNAEQAWHYHVIPYSLKEDNLYFLIDVKNEKKAIIKEELELITAKNIVFSEIEYNLIIQFLSKYYRRQKNNLNKKENVTYKPDDFLNNLISEAKDIGSSDIHIEIYEEKCRVRFRIDGLLVERYNVPKTDYPSLVNKIKIKANLDIAEKRLPQDGRIFFEFNDLRFDIRVSVLPTLHGEKLVLRLLNKDSANIDIQNLGFSENELNAYLEGIKKPNGIILISGPTGSGKTTTLYATLKILNKERNNVLTIEDPIEYTLDGVNQVQLKESIGLTFSSALRTFLRQDPDVIMVGEIRDGDTAQIAIRAALTGHLVLSTIHTNSAWGTISRLLDMGVAPYLLANTLNSSVAQRLVRVLCKNCKQKKIFNNSLLPPKFKPFYDLDFYFDPMGCDECYHTGYKGRKAIYEVIPIDFELSEAIKNGEFSVEKLLEEREIKTLSRNAFDLIAEGITSIEEAYPILINY